MNIPTEYNAKNLKKALKGNAKEILAEFATMLKEWDTSLQTPSEYHEVIDKIIKTKEIGFGKIGMPLRVALLGSMTGAGLDEIMAIIGVEETLKRVENLLNR